MTKKLLFVTTILLVVACVAFAADVTGKWTFEQQGRNGAQVVTITLKQSGTDLTGTVPGMAGRGGGGGGGGAAAAEQPISSGKVNGNNISFEVKRTTQNGEMVTKYEGTVNAAGDTINLKITRPGMQGGQPTTVDVVAKKASS
jgi:hypothetical protein